MANPYPWTTGQTAIDILNHHTRHEDGGGDEISLSGLAVDGDDISLTIGGETVTLEGAFEDLLEEARAGNDNTAKLAFLLGRIERLLGEPTEEEDDDIQEEIDEIPMA